MTSAAQKVVEQFLALSPEEQDEVRARIESGPDLHPSWDAEVRRRIEAAESGAEEMFSAEDVYAEARRALRER